MDDQSPSPQNGGETNNRVPPAEVAERGDTPAAQTATAEQLEEVEKQMTGFERATLRWAKLAVGLSGVAALFVCLQWYEMHSGGTDTHTLAEAAKKQADKMETMSDAADKIRQASENMVTQEQRIADNAKIALDASNRQSKAALDATVTAFRSDQRAWVGIGEYRVEQFDDKQPFKMIIPFTNSGKSPAIEGEDGMLYQFSDKPILGPIAKPQYVFEKIPALAPQGKYAMTLANPEAPARYDRIMNGTAYMAYFGIVRYRDVYSKTIHTTTFCLVYDRQTKQMVFCQSGNDMN